MFAAVWFGNSCRDRPTDSSRSPPPVVPTGTTPPPKRSLVRTCASGYFGFLARPAKLGAVHPDAMQDGGDLAGDGDASLLGANPLGQPHTLGLQGRKPLHLAQQHVSRLVEASSGEGIAAFRNPPLAACLAGLVAGRR